MIQFVQGDILRAETDALVNTVNTVGVMGKGVALQFKRQFPDNFAFYREACERGEVQPGKMLVFPTGSTRHVTHYLPHEASLAPKVAYRRHKSRLG